MLSECETKASVISLAGAALSWLKLVFMFLLRQQYVCHLLFSITFLEAFPTAAGNNQRLLLANSLRLSSFQFCEFETIPEDKINTKLKRCVVVRGSCRRRRSWIQCRYELSEKVTSWSENTWSPLNGWRFLRSGSVDRCLLAPDPLARRAQSYEFRLMRLCNGILNCWDCFMLAGSLLINTQRLNCFEECNKLWKLTFNLLALQRCFAGRYSWKHLFICVNFL